jgi:hypothetical protein
VSTFDAGGYQARERSDGYKQFYRFHKPMNKSYPYMIELFSGRPQNLNSPEGFPVTKVAVDQGILSLSAILLDEDYYAALQNHKIILNGVSILDHRLLIPFKAKAFLDLTKRQAEGERMDADDIKKHKNDVYRLVQLLTAETSVALPDAIRDDLTAYLDAVDGDESFDPNTFGVQMTKQDGATLLRTVYKL